MSDIILGNKTLKRVRRRLPSDYTPTLSSLNVTDIFNENDKNSTLVFPSFTPTTALSQQRSLSIYRELEKHYSSHETHDEKNTPQTEDEDKFSFDFDINDINEEIINHTPKPPKNKKLQNICCNCKAYFLIFIEGDLAGFQFWWILISILFLFIKISDNLYDISWTAIFLVPFGNALLTGCFDYILRKYQSKHAIESLAKRRFFLLCSAKLFLSIYSMSYFIWGENTFLYRFGKEFGDQKQACNCQIICIYVSMIIAVVMSEIMISIVLVNSEQNLSKTRTPMVYRVILFIIRPFVWVYNRTMVIFLCFYSIYGCIYVLFVLGALCDHYCLNEHCSDLQNIGIHILFVPFTVPNYLFVYKMEDIFSAESWKYISDEELMQKFVISFLVQSFYVDIINSFWQFSRRYIFMYICQKSKQEWITRNSTMSREEK